MKKIEIKQEEIFEIAKFLKDKIEGQKVFIYQKGSKILIKFSQKIDRLKLEEIKTELQLNYPDKEFVFQLNF